MKPTSLLQSLKRNRNVLYIFILAMVVALVWIGLGVYQATVKSSVPANIQKLTAPLSPNIDSELLQSLSSRTMFTADELANFPVNREILESDGTVIEIPLPTPSPTPVSTQSGTPSQSASPSATPTATPPV